MSSPGRKKVLILTYYWPPSGGAGVQRWLKFTKYLRDFNYEPVIYTAEDPEYPSIDETLFHDIPEGITVLKTRVWEPYKLYKWFTLQKRGHRINTGFLQERKKKGILEGISVWIRGNCFIPDARRFWIRPSIRYLVKYIKDHPVDLIVSTGPPHSLHLIGMGVSNHTRIPWIADFRDPWTNIDFYHELRLSKRSDQRHHMLEKKVIEAASAVIVINREMELYFGEMKENNIHFIPNGFDPEDFSEIPDRDNREGNAKPGEGKPGSLANQKTGSARKSDSRGEKFSLTHIGTIVPTRNPANLWKVLSELINENKNFEKDLEVILIGARDFSVIKSIEESGLTKYITNIDYLPHQDVIMELKSSQVLLLLINNTLNARGILTGKLFEYINSVRPILAIGPEGGEVDHLLRETKTGVLIDFNDRTSLKKQILEYYRAFRENELIVKPENLENYSRKNLTKKITRVFDQFVLNNDDQA